MNDFKQLKTLDIIGIVNTYKRKVKNILALA